jgi:hypothetical protein
MHARLRALFNWQYSGVVIPTCVGLSIAMDGIALGLATAGVAWRWVFVLAYFWLIVGLVFSLGRWLTSNQLQAKNPNTWNSRRRKKAGPQDWKTYRRSMWGWTALIAVLFSTVIAVTKYGEYQMQLWDPHGWLYSASYPMPDIHRCGLVPDNAMVVILGKQAVIATKFPKIVMRVDNEDFITVFKKGDSVAISLDVLGVDQKIIARIEKNEITVNPNNSFRRRRADLSSLQIEDQFGRQVFAARYLNQRALKVTGLLYLPHLPSVYGPWPLDEGEVTGCVLDGGSIQVWSGTMRHP